MLILGYSSQIRHGNSAEAAVMSANRCKQLIPIALLLLTFSLFHSTQSFAAPYSRCSRTSDSVEQLICKYDALGALDRELAKHYKLIVRKSGKMRLQVIALQTSWLAQRNAECPDRAEIDERSTCLIKLYADRIDHISRYSGGFSGLSQDWLRSDAFAIIVKDPRSAEKVFRSDNSESAAIGLALVLRLFSDQTDKNRKELATILTRLKLKMSDGMHYFPENVPDYDGSVESLSFYITVFAGPVELPCALFERYPTLMKALRPYYSSSQDAWLPTAQCVAPEYDVPKSYELYRNFVQKFDYNYLMGCQGTICFSGYRSVMAGAVELAALPHKILENKESPPLNVMPLSNWAYDSLWNWHSFQKVRKLFLRARSDLARYYEDRFGLPEAEALRTAHTALWNYAPRDPDLPIDTHPNPVRVAILDTDATPTLDELSKKSSSAMQFASTNRYADPPMLLAVEHPSIIATLLSLKIDVNQTNAFGKTALMTAAQFNQRESVEFLLKSGASVNAVTLAPRMIPNNSPHNDLGDVEDRLKYFSINNGSRTALMYAAANASLSVIEVLLKAGADKTIVDSKGKSALDYLLGNGPVPANKLIGGVDLEKAKQILAH